MIWNAITCVPAVRAPHEEEGTVIQERNALRAQRRDPMRLLKCTLLLFGCCLFVLWPYVGRAEVLTNDTVLTMVKAGLGEDLIISKVKSSQNQFDLSTAGILKLKGEGVSEKILQAMIETSAKGTPTGQEPAGVTTAVPSGPFAWGIWQGPVSVTNASSLFVKLQDKVGEILPVGAQVQHSMAKHFIPFYFGPGDNWYYLRGPKSVVRINEKQPVFYTKMNPGSFLLVKLTYQAERDIRYVIGTGSAFKNTVPITINKQPNELFELAPNGALELGEYAFMSSGMFYDFGIE
jgi:hypothetical protein